MNKRIVIAAVFIGVLCAGLVAFNFARQLFAGDGGMHQRQATSVEASPVQPGAWEPSIDAVGTARASRGSDIAAEVGGVVTKINFSANDRAKAGQLLVQLNDSVEQAELRAAEANTKLYTSQLERSEKLRQNGYVSQASHDNTKALLDVAKSTRDRQKAIIEQKSIEAPFEGTLGIARVDVGQFLEPGVVVVTLQDLDRMKVDFTVPEEAVAHLTLQQTARFGADKDNLPFTGRIIGIDPKIDPASRLVAVQAEVSDANGQIRPGQFLRVRVDLPGETNVIALPQTAVVPSLYGDYVFLVTKDDTGASVAKQRFVTTGRRDGTRIEIVKGLAAGDTVITTGQNKLQDGAPVAVAAPTGAPRVKAGP